MNVKEKIMERVNAIDNPELLTEILELISAETEAESPYKLNPYEQKSINEGMADVNEGRTYSQQEADNLISKWLHEKSGGH
ncbi:hypothetical protein [Owenweeksia hongkongensis]|uniref:hypothetical protein n=1 Tax=Owenweeksia hongkongensis TaxID=253245 RepID=UPI003A916E4A